MISATNLSKRYGPHTAVDDVTFTCTPGTITGFLGPNGAGKSTTMRMICGLTPPTTGTATINGQSYAQLANPGREVGVLLDASAQHPWRTGREVLRLTGEVLRPPLQRRGVGIERVEDQFARVGIRVEELLAQVGLAGPAARRPVRRYSLGMRQRLGIAHALVGYPSVLILDEPANGLDPEGIFWIRGLLRDFADRGGTVLLSSHLLREVEAVADRLVVIANGQIVAQGSKDELLADGGVRIRAKDLPRLRQALEADGVTVTPTTDNAIVARTDMETVGRIAAETQAVLLELRPTDGSGLEELYLALTTHENKAEAGSKENAR